MPEPVRSNLNLGLTISIVMIGALTLGTITTLSMPSMNLTPEERSNLFTLIIGFVTPIIAILGGILLRDLHNGINSRVEEMKQMTKSIGVTQGREEMRGELEQMRASMQESLRAAARQIVDEAAEANKRNVLELAAAARQLAADTAAAAVQRAIADRKAEAEARKEAEKPDPQPEQKEAAAEFSVTSDVPVTIVEKK